MVDNLKCQYHGKYMTYYAKKVARFVPGTAVRQSRPLSLTLRFACEQRPEPNAKHASVGKSIKRIIREVVHLTRPMNCWEIGNLEKQDRTILAEWCQRAPLEICTLLPDDFIRVRLKESTEIFILMVSATRSKFGLEAMLKAIGEPRADETLHAATDPTRCSVK